jgi:hypothetical protein
MLRREVVLGGLLTIVTGSSDACCQSNNPLRRQGCMIPDTMAHAFFARSSDHETYETGNERILLKSGIPDFDLALVHTLSDLTDQFKVLPAFGFFDDWERPDALATKATRGGTRKHGTVLFGRRMLQKTMAEISNPVVAVTAICAHEYGHIVQFQQRNFQETLLAGQRTVKRVELHADFLAGYYAGSRWLRNNNYEAVVFATKLESLGDNDVDKLDHHGTPEERGRVVVRGFLAAKDERLGLNDAIRAGQQYVMTL